MILMLTIIIFAGGTVALLYTMLALFSLMNHARIRKDLSEKYGPGVDLLATRGPAVAWAFWERAKILLQKGRVVAALADCKGTLNINPNHADAKRLWEHLFPPELVSTVQAGEAPLPASETEQTNSKEIDKTRTSEPEETEPSCSG